MKKILFIAALALPLLWSCGGGSPKQLSDKDILTLVYQKAGGDQWEEKDKENWLSEDIATWKGVEVNGEGRVTKLQIRGAGEIPAEISGLTELKDLRIVLKNKNVNVTNAIPASISELTKLENLALNISDSPVTAPNVNGLKDLKKIYYYFPNEVPFPEIA